MCLSDLRDLPGIWLPKEAHAEGEATRGGSPFGSNHKLSVTDKRLRRIPELPCLN